MNGVSVDVRSGAVRPRPTARSFANRIGTAQGSLPPVTVIFDQMNQRRLQLIEKDFASGLSPGEEAELKRLQRETAGIMEFLHPLSTTMLDQMEALATQLEIHSGTDNP